MFRFKETTSGRTQSHTGQNNRRSARTLAGLCYANDANVTRIRANVLRPAFSHHTRKIGGRESHKLAVATCGSDDAKEPSEMKTSMATPYWMRQVRTHRFIDDPAIAFAEQQHSPVVLAAEVT